MNEGMAPERRPGEGGAELAAARAAVVQALRDLERGERDSMEGLRLALCRVVRALRSNGMASDEIMAEMRDLVTRPVTPQGHRVPPIAREALVELTLRWCAEEYASSEEP